MSEKYTEYTIYLHKKLLTEENLEEWKTCGSNNKDEYTKCILKIPVEEKKIVITESEFESIINSFYRIDKYSNETYINAEGLKQKLFSKERE